MWFFNFITIVIIVILALRLLGRYLFPWLIKRYLEKFQRNFFDQNPHVKDAYNRQNEGEVKVKTPPIKVPKKDDLGEYVDFEEVE